VGDRDLSTLLEPFTSAADLDFCYSVGFSLIRCRNRAGVPASSRAPLDDKFTRTLSISALRSINKDEGLGYDANKPAEVNAPAIKAWEDWYEKAGPKLFE